MAEQDLATGFDVEGKIYQTDLRQIMGTLQSKDPSITESDKIRLLLLFVQKKATGKLLVQCSTESCTTRYFADFFCDSTCYQTYTNIVLDVS